MVPLILGTPLVQVMLDMHALPGCSTPFQSYAGIECAPEAPNFWEGAPCVFYTHVCRFWYGSVCIYANMRGMCIGILGK